MARAAYEECAESDGTPVIDFALDALLFAQSEHASDETLLPRLAMQALREWTMHARRKRRAHTRRKRPGRRPRRYRCRLCVDTVAADEMRDHLAGHSPAAESAVENPAEFFEKIEGQPAEG